MVGDYLQLYIYGFFFWGCICAVQLVVSMAVLSKELFNPVITRGFSVPFLFPQTQMEEFRQLKEALQKMPSFKGGGGGGGKGQQQQLQVLKEQPLGPGSSQLQLMRQKVR